MSELIDYAKGELLLAMYQSVERMNRHISNQNSQGVLSEQHLQVNLRRNFEELSKNEPETSA